MRQTRLRGRGALVQRRLPRPRVMRPPATLPSRAPSCPRGWAVRRPGGRHRRSMAGSRHHRRPCGGEHHPAWRGCGQGRGQGARPLRPAAAGPVPAAGWQVYVAAPSPALIRRKQSPRIPQRTKPAETSPNLRTTRWRFIQTREGKRTCHADRRIQVGQIADVFSVLSQDHEEVQRMLAELEKGPSQAT